MTVSIGVDVGSGVIKTALFRVEGEKSAWLSRWDARIRQRDTFTLVEESMKSVLDSAGLARDDVDYVATTGEGESLPGATGHFYSMTTHARGALYLNPEARAVLDIGALHGRAMLVDERGKVLGSRMTSQCASGSGQFLENICRYLGITLEEIGPLSLRSEKPEQCSSICAVLAETDVINMVSRGIAAPDIIRGIHQSMAGRYVKLLTSLGARGVVLVTGGLAADVGLLAALRESAGEAKHALEVRTHRQSALAGAIGAALWGAFRARKLARLGLSLAGEERS